MYSQNGHNCPTNMHHNITTNYIVYFMLNSKNAINFKQFSKNLLKKYALLLNLNTKVPLMG